MFRFFVRKVLTSFPDQGNLGKCPEIQHTISFPDHELTSLFLLVGSFYPLSTGVPLPS